MLEQNRDRPVSVGLLALPESTPTALYGLYEVFNSVGAAWSELTGEPPAGPAMDARIVAERREPFACALGLPITPHAALGDELRPDVVVATDLSLNPQQDPRGRWPAAGAWLRRQYDRGAIVASVCTGSVLLADAGLLEHRQATTHWSAATLFATYFPNVALRPERILSLDGPEQRIVTSGGAASWEDLALYLVARLCGSTEATRIAKLFVFGDRSEGQLPYAALGRPRRHGDAIIARCQEWLADHYATADTVAGMLARSGLTARTFNRRFRAATGRAPLDYVQALRIEEAKQLLETTDEPADAIGRQVGYEDPAFFRRLFKRRAGTTPARYRHRFQSVGKPPRGRKAEQP